MLSGAREFDDFIKNYNSLDIINMFSENRYSFQKKIARIQTRYFLQKKHFSNKDGIIRRPKWTRKPSISPKNHSMTFLPSPDPDVEINAYRRWHPYFASLKPGELFRVLGTNKYLSIVFDMGSKYGETVFDSEEWNKYFGLSRSNHPKKKSFKQKYLGS